MTLDLPLRLGAFQALWHTTLVIGVGMLDEQEWVERNLHGMGNALPAVIYGTANQGRQADTPQR
jgi:hypothetical protein